MICVKNVTAAGLDAFACTCSFTIEAGTYRLNSSLVIEQTTNFALNASNAQLIAESAGHLALVSNVNFSMQGPAYLDADPFGSTQVQIH